MSAFWLKILVWCARISCWCWHYHLFWSWCWILTKPFKAQVYSRIASQILTKYWSWNFVRILMLRYDCALGNVWLWNDQPAVLNYARQGLFIQRAVLFQCIWLYFMRMIYQACLYGFINNLQTKDGTQSEKSSHIHYPYFRIGLSKPLLQCIRMYNMKSCILMT